ncbi:DNA-J related domain-containing protein, partial [Pseudomonas otitidis]
MGTLSVNQNKLQKRIRRQAGEAALEAPDPLRAYYLDMNQLRDTTERDVDRLLA